jgi:CheY-like chemotaxis protein
MKTLAASASQAADQPLILLVEDNAVIRVMTRDFLRDTGYQIVEAADGEEALAIMEAGLSPALLVSDIRMPGSINGLKLLALMRKLYPGIPVLLASSQLPRDHEGHVDVAFLPKPYTPSALASAVQGLIGDI